MINFERMLHFGNKGLRKCIKCTIIMLVIRSNLNEMTTSGDEAQIVSSNTRRSQ